MLRGGKRTMKAILLCAIALFAASAHAQSVYDFTLTNDPALCGTFCNTTAGSGMFTVSPNLYQSIAGSGYPITSLSGTLNGAAMTLAPLPNGAVIGNLYYQSYLPISWFAPLYFSTSSGQWSLQQLGVDHPGTGQWLTAPNGSVTYVAFTVTPVSRPTAPAPSAPPIPTYRPPFSTSSSGLAPLGRPTQSASSLRARNPVLIEVSVPAAIATVVAIYEWEHHRRGRRDAEPAGRY